jgi:hypothetical protein
VVRIIVGKRLTWDQLTGKAEPQEVKLWFAYPETAGAEESDKGNN